MVLLVVASSFANSSINQPSTQPSSLLPVVCHRHIHRQTQHIYIFQIHQQFLLVHRPSQVWLHQVSPQGQLAPQDKIATQKLLQEERTLAQQKAREEQKVIEKDPMEGKLKEQEQKLEQLQAREEKRKDVET
jgi:hypothetical protein